MALQSTLFISLTCDGSIRGLGGQEDTTVDERNESSLVGAKDATHLQNRGIWLLHCSPQSFISFEEIT